MNTKCEPLPLVMMFNCAMQVAWRKTEYFTSNANAICTEDKIKIFIKLTIFAHTSSLRILVCNLQNPEIQSRVSVGRVTEPSLLVEPR